MSERPDSALTRAGDGSATGNVAGSAGAADVSAATGDDAASASPAAMAAAFLAEVRRRLGEGDDVRLAAALAPAVSRLTDRLVIAACDRLSRGDMAGFFRAALEGMTPEERSAWRRDVTRAWRRAAERRWQETRELRREIVEAILFAKALAI